MPRVSAKAGGWVFLIDAGPLCTLGRAYYLTWRSLGARLFYLDRHLPQMTGLSTVRELQVPGPPLLERHLGIEPHDARRPVGKPLQFRFG